MQLAVEGEHFKIYQGNSADMSQVVKAASVALIVTSPPYPYVNQPEPDYVTFENVKDFDACHAELAKVWKACFNALEDEGRLCIDIYDIPTGAGGVAPNVCRTIKECLNIGFTLREQFIWSKGSVYSPPSGSFPYPKGVLTANSWESILVFQRPQIFGQRAKKTAVDLPEAVLEASKLTGVEQGYLMDPVWKIPPEPSRDHPFPFPVELPGRLIRLYSFAGDTILDPFCGSATTLKAAIERGRNAIGFELSDKYIEIARLRLAQQALF